MRDRTNNPEPRWERPPVAAQAQWAHAWYRQAKETKRGGMSGRESEYATVPRKAGNRPNGTRWREGRAGLRNLCEER